LLEFWGRSLIYRKSGVLVGPWKAWIEKAKGKLLKSAGGN